MTSKNHIFNAHICGSIGNTIGKSALWSHLSLALWLSLTLWLSFSLSVALSLSLSLTLSHSLSHSLTLSYIFFVLVTTTLVLTYNMSHVLFNTILRLFIDSLTPCTCNSFGNSPASALDHLLTRIDNKCIETYYEVTIGNSHPIWGIKNI